MAPCNFPSRRVLFRCDGNSATGLGHLSRCINVARHIRQHSPGTSLAFWGHYDDFASGLLAMYGLRTFPMHVPRGDVTGIPQTHHACSEGDVLVLDSYAIRQEYIDGLKAQPFRLAVIDDHQRNNLHGCDLVICFRAGAEAIDYGAHHQLLGPSFLPAKPELHALRQHNLSLPADRSIQRVLVFLSGGEAGETHLPAVLTALGEFPGLEVSYLASREARSPSTSGARHLALTPAIEAVYAKTDFVICGGGLTKYECAYAGILNACLSLTPLQDEDTRAMAASDLTLDLGPAGATGQASLRGKIGEFLQDTGAQELQRRAFVSKLTPDGPSQVAKAVLTL